MYDKHINKIIKISKTRIGHVSAVPCAPYGQTHINYSGRMSYCNMSTTKRSYKYDDGGCGMLHGTTAMFIRTRPIKIN